MEIVVVNFGEGKPIYTEAVFPDPEVRSIFANREEEARSRRRLARRRNRNARHRRNNASSDRANSNNTQGDSQSSNPSQDNNGNRDETSRVREDEDGWFVLSIPLSNSSSPSRYHNRSPNGRQQLAVPPANQNRHHPGEEEMEFWLSPEATPEPSPAASPVVKRIGKKWINNALRQVSGCHTCRGDLAILGRNRPQLREASFLQVV